ncbi:hypothetical protein CFIMG_008098RA [Ceratocystis fimbriata CBS 114723]|uniref:Uncharacterized protein n=1 Tax=Ceratocystis fimbriata CBS 114723 TaxID=1035309 RepID=A0A2C5WT92_9PEZI|nr:hypothetical protein CFIMG_008098RA [Ceratocystis fimbriata CBS 114723]
MLVCEPLRAMKTLCHQWSSQTMDSDWHQGRMTSQSRSGMRLPVRVCRLSRAIYTM